MMKPACSSYRHSLANLVSKCQCKKLIPVRVFWLSVRLSTTQSALAFQLRSAIPNSNALCSGDGEPFEKPLRIFNKAAQLARFPCVVLQPRDEVQLASTLRAMHLSDTFSNLSISVKNGGHQPAAWSLSGAVVLDLMNLREVKIDTASKTAQVAAGARWGSVHKAATMHGLLAHGATDHDVGVSGSTLVGGITFLSKTRGLVANSLKSLRLCLMNGTILDLHDGSTNPQHLSLLQLFRAGVGVAAIPVGVVTEWTFQLFEPEPVYFGGEGSRTMHSLHDAANLASQLLALRKSVPDHRLAVDIGLNIGNNRSGHSVSVLLFFNGPFDEGFTASSALLQSFPDVSPQKYPNYEKWTDSLSAGRHSRIGLSSWHGAFVAEDGMHQILKHFGNADLNHQGLEGVFEDRIHTLRSGPKSGMQNDSMLINYVCRLGKPCSRNNNAEKFYAKFVRPNQVAEYLGYMSLPHRREIVKGLKMWEPAAMRALRCLRAGLGADMLIGGAAFQGDAEAWRQIKGEMGHSISELNSSADLSSCHASSLLEDPLDWCGASNQQLPFRDHVALVIGGTGGIGEEVAHLLSQKGAEVIIAARDLTKCEKIASRAWAIGGFIQCDKVELTDVGSMLSLMERHPSTTMLVHSAAAKKEALWVNHLSTLFLGSELFKRNPRARVIVVGSGAAENAIGTDIQTLLLGRGNFTGGSFREYCATKNMQLQALEALKVQSGADIRMVKPTVTVRTNLVKDALPDMPETMKGLLRFGDGKLAATQVVNAALLELPVQLSSHLQMRPAAGMQCLDGCSQRSCRAGTPTETSKILAQTLKLLEGERMRIGKRE